RLPIRFQRSAARDWMGTKNQPGRGSAVPMERGTMFRWPRDKLLTCLQLRVPAYICCGVLLHGFLLLSGCRRESAPFTELEKSRDELPRASVATIHANQI